MLFRSDHALYKGKTNGRNQVVIWDPKDTSEDEYKMALLDQKAFLYASCPIDNEEKNDPSNFELEQNEEENSTEEIK